MELNKKTTLAEILDTVKDLLSFRTVDGRQTEMEKAKSYILDFFKGSSVHIKEYDFNGYPALVLTGRDTNKPRFFLQGHIDVVEGSDDQFRPRQEGEYLYGRGSVDMKTFDAIAMHLLRDLSAGDEYVDLGIMLTSDEETGSQNGAQKLAAMGYRPDILINGDGGYNHAIIHAEKGILKMKLSAHSEPGRHPYPWDGQNAFDIMALAYKAIAEMFPGHLMATNEDNWYTTFSSYDIRVENEPSFAPHYAEMKINIYFTDDLTTDELCEKIKHKVNKVSLEKISASERVYLSPESAYVLRFRELMQKNFGRDIVVRSENGSSDARFFTGLDIPILIVKVVGEDHHGPNERMHIPSIIPLYNTLKDFVHEYAKKPENQKIREAIHA